MICPQCGAENPPGATRCPECGAETAGETASAEWVDDVVVLETTEEGQLMVARSLLEAEGIPCFTQGEESQRIVGSAPLRLLVPLGDEEEARALLAHLESIAPSDE